MSMLNKRSYEAEILDGQSFTKEELFQNLKELRLVNQFLGGHANSAIAFENCLRNGFVPDAIVDIGCGGGDTIEFLQKKFGKKLPGVRWIGTDLNPWCLEYAKDRHSGNGIQYIQSDFREVQAGKILFHASLFFHHFRDEEITEFLRKIKSMDAALAINDLHRHPLAYAAIAAIGNTPGVGRLFRNDAPLSVKRGFSNSDWQRILENAGLENTRVSWAWAFRHIISIVPDKQ